MCVALASKASGAVKGLLALITFILTAGLLFKLLVAPSTKHTNYQGNTEHRNADCASHEEWLALSRLAPLPRDECASIWGMISRTPAAKVMGAVSRGER